jgi:hypothetical protein
MENHLYAELEQRGFINQSSTSEIAQILDDKEMTVYL